MTVFDAVLFDLDGTLCQHEQDAETIYFGSFERAGIDPFGEPSDLWNALDGSPPADEERHAEHLAAGFTKVAAQYGRQRVDAAALADGFLSTVDFSRVGFRPGAADALERARDEGAVGLVTNGPEYRQSVKLEALGLADAFDTVVFAGDMARRKPHADPFDRAVADLGVDAAGSLYVGDSLEHDVAGAQGAGLDVAWCPRDGETDPGEYRPEYVLASLADFGSVFGGQ
ncbi:putative hydrolase of the HAD superfamily [Halogranum gelatinilyticum]|uniref:Putative hydrolase of the HAD superfamily n=1 Tax=Halogranum gelatinilyticum TaxID=660521 RepID=A0A1G9TE93_9EURY|nr:HAD family hydrolase [Halogranum gelatinilyticum]SDM45942.1 putative hydrolase of the HAD superfamily [Halogranum gelatinilyticum]